MGWAHFYAEFVDVMNSMGRPLQEVQVIAVSKAQAPERVAEVIKKYSSIKDLGENYFQELEGKRRFFLKENHLKWHYLGALQSKKIAALSALADCLHSVTREKELEKLAELQISGVSVPNFYFQVNISGESQKLGALPQRMPSLIEKALSLNLDSKLLGFMGVASLSSDEKVSAQFASLRTLRDQLLPGRKLNMGMSGDYKLALKEGADVIRVGSLVFGLRG